MSVRIHQTALEANWHEKLGIRILDDFAEGSPSNLLDDISVDIEKCQRGSVLVGRNVESLINRFNRN
jgi:hypothetical protein